MSPPPQKKPLTIDQLDTDPPPPGIVALQGDALDALVLYAARWKTPATEKTTEKRRPR
jgi:hypothetical protein